MSKLIINIAFLFAFTNFIFAQPTIRDAVHYSQLSSFEEDQSIVSMKMSLDGNKIVFATGGYQIKIFTINTDGSGLTLVFDYQSVGSGPTVDISANGDKVIWLDILNNLYIANSDGSQRMQLVENIPNPDNGLPDPKPQIPITPRITADGSQVFFMESGRDPMVAGAWKVNADGSNATQIFNYVEMSQEVFERDGSEYNYNLAFTDGFDINMDGSTIIFGTKIFKIEEGDLSRGHAIVANGSTFHKLCEYAVGNQPFATNLDDGIFLVFKLEWNDLVQANKINVYFEPLGTGDPIKVIDSIDQFGGATMTQISANGSGGIVHGANGRLPITLVDKATGSHTDLVSIDGISRGIGAGDFSLSAYPSINGDGDKFCFLAYSNPPQIWIGHILSDGAGSEPKINGVQFNPSYVTIDGISTAEISAYVSDINDPIDFVTFETFKDGSYLFRALTADGGPPFFPRLHDDGTLGDQSPGDNTFTNNTVRKGVAENPVGDYTIRIAAVNTSHRKITMVDAEPFSILDQTTSVENNNTIPNKLELYQNYPNPFNPITTIKYSIPTKVNGEKSKVNQVRLKIFDILGREIATIVNDELASGVYEVEWDSGTGPSGIYYYELNVGTYKLVNKMILLK